VKNIENKVFYYYKMNLINILRIRKKLKRKIGLLVDQHNSDTKRVAINKVMHRKKIEKSLLFICLLFMVGIALNYLNNHYYRVHQ
jgi:hypothetical protein